MTAVVDAMWDAFGHDRPGPGRQISWVGFYLKVDGRDELVLGPRRDKPACSPIGLHGACGRALLSKRALVVGDVTRLGTGYIACDPRDRSEVVVPCMEADGACWGVLDVDSHDVGAFDEVDARRLGDLLAMAALGRAGGSALAVESV